MSVNLANRLCDYCMHLFCVRLYFNLVQCIRHNNKTHRLPFSIIQFRSEIHFRHTLWWKPFFDHIGTYLWEFLYWVKPRGRTLVGTLGETLILWNVCIFCPGRSSRNTTAIIWLRYFYTYTCKQYGVIKINPFIF